MHACVHVTHASAVAVGETRPARIAAVSFASHLHPWQIRTEDLLVPEKDATRNTVQKSCCIMSREPCFGSVPLLSSPPRNSAR